MHYRVFYLFARSGEAISSASAVEMSAKAITEQLVPRLQTEDDYLGLIDAQETVLQILYEPAEQRYWVELPVDAAKASYGCYLAGEALKAFLLALPKVFEREHISGLEYRPW
ncbi:hypothetical protein SAMN05421644_1237 [Allochromatium warmingii]|uniref:Uncharacterized protein n=1 Tax=Allochromatium warmingii TaxID=61595 RepID=A0A1H3G670_ALLWA|nr:hypothetical protein [Allochromatium warmingii]SDX98766.1 hypothetical protein SAMN05421644_1237 [Allochromatium warmingii]